VQGLEDLKKSYQDRATELPKQHIGVYVKEISQVAACSSRCKRDFTIRILVRSTMSLVLDQYHDVARLNEPGPNEQKWTPLRYAIECNAIDCLEILLAKGADPYDASCTEAASDYDKNLKAFNSTGRFDQDRRGLYYMSDLVKVWAPSPTATEHSEQMLFACRPMSMETSKPFLGHQKIVLGQDFLSGLTGGVLQNCWGPDEYRTWCHVSFTNVSRAPRSMILTAE
jgi:hypothetical protein